MFISILAMRNKNILILLLFLSVGHINFAQIGIPPLDFQLKSGAAFLPGGKDSNENFYNYKAPLLYAEINWNIGQYLAVGGFVSSGIYSKSNYEISFNYPNSVPVSYGGSHLEYGAKIRFSTGRAPRFRPFTEFSYGKLEMYMEKNIYRIATSTNFIGFTLGLMIRLNSKLYIVLPQANIRFRSNGFFFEAPGDFLGGSYSPFVEVCTGLSYNIGKKK